MQFFQSTKILSVFITVFTTLTSFAQDFTVNWSSEFSFDSKELTDYNILGESDENIVMIASDQFPAGSEPPQKKKLVVFNKHTLSEVSVLFLDGYKENKKEHPDLQFHTCVVRADKVLVFWTKSTENSEELLLEEFNSNLSEHKPLQKVYINVHAFDLKRMPLTKDKSTIIVASDKINTEEILIGGEIPVANDYVRFEYVILNSDMSTSELRTVKLPMQMRNKSFGMCAKYEYLENGDLLIYSSYTGEQGKGITDNVDNGKILLSDMNPYHTVSYLNTDTQEIATIELQTYGLSYTSPVLKSVFVNNDLRVFGLGHSGDHKFSGIYCGAFNLNNMSVSSEFITVDPELVASSGTDPVLKDVLIQNDKIVFLLGSPQFSFGVFSKRLHLLCYNTANEFQWSQYAPTFDSKEAFSLFTESGELKVLFGDNFRDETKNIHVNRIGVNIIGYSTLDMSSGEIIDTKKLQLDVQVYFWNMKLLSDKLYFIGGKNHAAGVNPYNLGSTTF